MSQSEALLMDILGESFDTQILMTEKLIKLERRLLRGDPVSLVEITKDIQDNQETICLVQKAQNRLASLKGEQTCESF